jgi:hypothetical protein
MDRARKYHQRQLSLGNAQDKIQKVKDNFHEARGRWKKAGNKLLLAKHLARQHEKELIAKFHARSSWHGWISQKYWNLAVALENAAAKNYALSTLSKTLGLQPKRLALGTAEGVLLAKLAMPLTVPLSLLLIVLMFGNRNALSVAKTQECAEEAAWPVEEKQEPE